MEKTIFVIACIFLIYCNKSKSCSVMECRNINHTRSIGDFLYCSSDNCYIELRLKDSHIMVLPPHFTEWSFETVNMEHIGLREIAPIAFHGMKERLISLSLNHNELTNINWNMFTYLSSLRVLHLAHNRIEKIEEHAFSGMKALETLSLNNNHIITLPVYIFATLNDLKDLDISVNNILSLDNLMFTNNPNINSLRINKNKISYLPVDIFKNNRDLSFIDISYNPIKSIDYSMFFELINLTELNVSYTEKKMEFHITRDVFNRVKYANFEGKNLKNIEWININSISLNLANNNLSYINNTLFHDYLQLRYLNLSFNGITDIENNAFDSLQYLKTLDLKGNKLKSIKHGLFKNLKNLEYLDISLNNLQNLSYGIFDNLKKLTYLDISSNKISSYPDYIFHGLKSLRHLSLANNTIEDYINAQQILEILPFLQTIALDNNSWNCYQLVQIVHLFERAAVNVTFGKTFHTNNINGIECKI